MKVCAAAYRLLDLLIVSSLRERETSLFCSTLYTSILPIGSVQQVFVELKNIANSGKYVFKDT